MTNIQKLTKSINFINANGRSIIDFAVIDDVPYKVTGYFYDYHKGTSNITEKQPITEEQAGGYLLWPSISGAINQILLEHEECIAKQNRLANFYATDEF